MGHVSEEDAATMRALVDGISALEVRELAIAALRTWYRGARDRSSFALHGDLGVPFVHALGQRKNRDLDAAHVTRLKEALVYRLHEDWMNAVVDFTAWFLSAAFAVPVLQPYDSSGSIQYPIRYRLTSRGHAFLSASDDHPLLPGAAARVESRCPRMPPEVLSLIADARECLDRMLLRPAVVMMGVAYELAVEEVATGLIAAKKLDPKVLERNAAKRIAEVKKVIPIVLTPNSEQFFAAMNAYDFADRLRARRNDGSHTRPTYGFEDRSEVEELLVSAMRHLPALWSLAVAA